MLLGPEIPIVFATLEQNHFMPGSVKLQQQAKLIARKIIPIHHVQCKSWLADRLSY